MIDLNQGSTKFSAILDLPSDQEKFHLDYVTALHGRSLSWTNLGKELCLQARKNLSRPRSSKTFDFLLISAIVSVSCGPTSCGFRWRWPFLRRD